MLIDIEKWSEQLKLRNVFFRMPEMDKWKWESKN